MIGVADLTMAGLELGLDFGLDFGLDLGLNVELELDLGPVLVLDLAQGMTSRRYLKVIVQTRRT